LPEEDSSSSASSCSSQLTEVGHAWHFQRVYTDSIRCAVFFLLEIYWKTVHVARTTCACVVFRSSGCSFALPRFWTYLNVYSTRTDEDFNTWFSWESSNADPAIQNDIKSIILTIRKIWRPRNDMVFDNISPVRQDLVQSILDEAKLWLLEPKRLTKC
jgi:hypothetical protein